jgi:hypothetical protein
LYFVSRNDGTHAFAKRSPSTIATWKFQVEYPGERLADQRDALSRRSALAHEFRPQHLIVASQADGLKKAEPGLLDDELSRLGGMRFRRVA